VPALLVFGEHELLYDPWKVARRAEKIIPGIETDVVKGAGHAAIYDKPEIVNELVVEYLQKA
jgi:pimeloyl-ACP methyl ester carboxylesterase